MKKVSYCIEVSFCSTTYEDTIEVEDNATPEEIEEAVREAVFNEIGWGFEIEKGASQDEEN